MDGHPIMKEKDIEKILEQLSGEEEDFSIVAGDSTEEVNRWRQLDGIARMMRDKPAVETPTGLEERIMNRVRAHRPSPWRVFGDALLRPRKVSFHPLNALRSPVSGQECSFYFIMVGAFYAILGMILMVGLRRLGESLVTLGWVRWQPQIALATALCMVAMGIYLLKDGRLALSVARIGALIYLGFGFLNGIIVPLEWDIPVSALVSMLSTLIGVPTGFFLFRAIQNCGKRYA
jgi:hypothetical protein